MGRVYDALKRASNAQTNGATNNGNHNDNNAPNHAAPRANGKANGMSAAAVREEAQHPWDQSPLFASSKSDTPTPTAHSSASTAHTVSHVGSALSGVRASGAAGATLDAARSTRARVEFVSQDISQTRVEPHLVAVTQPRSAYCEQFRALRTRILHTAERRKLQAFVFTSVGIAEGKTLTALNLAWLLAQTDGVSALLIDSDLRQPCATDYFNIETGTGLSEVLSGEAGLQESIVRLEPAGLHLLPGGARRDDVAEILAGPRFGSVMAEVRRMFDYIIIDAPPLGIFTDANLLINRADAAMLVVRAGKTRYSAVEKLMEKLPRERMLGVILNRADEAVNESEYYYQRRYQRPRDNAPNAREEAEEAIAAQ